MLLTSKKLPNSRPTIQPVLQPVIQHCDCSHHPRDGDDYPTVHTPDSRDRSLSPEPQSRVGLGIDLSPGSRDVSPGSRVGRSANDDNDDNDSLSDAGNRRKVAKMLTSITNYFSNAAHDDVSEFKQGPAVDYPQIPGEDLRNPGLIRITTRYNPPRDAAGNITPSLRKSNSRASFTSVVSGTGGDDNTIKRPSLDLHNMASASSANSTGERKVKRRDTLEVPAPTYHAPARSEHRSSSSITSIVG